MTIFVFLFDLPQKKLKQECSPKTMLHLKRVTWNQKLVVSKRGFLLQRLIFRFHVKLQGRPVRFFKYLWRLSTKQISEHVSSTLHCLTNQRPKKTNIKQEKSLPKKSQVKALSRRAFHKALDSCFGGKQLRYVCLTPTLEFDAKWFDLRHPPQRKQKRWIPELRLGSKVLLGLLPHR